MRSGKLRDVVTLKRKETTRGELGEEIVSWKSVGTVFAQVIYEGGGESPSKRTEGDFTNRVIFLIRYRSDVISSDRLEYQGKVFTIDGLKPVSLGRYYDGLEIIGNHRE